MPGLLPHPGPIRIGRRCEHQETDAPERRRAPAFVLDRGRYESFEASDPTVQLFPGGINDRGVIVVSAFTPTADDPSAGARGFVLRDGIEGPFTEVRFPGAPRTVATGIDDRGRIVGVYENPNYQSPTATPRSELGLLSISARQRGGCSG